MPSPEHSMTVCIALLRGINMGGHKKVAMSELRALAAVVGLTDAKTLLQSGNLIFSASMSPAALELLLEESLLKRLALSTTVFVRRAAALTEIIARNPFIDEARRDASHLAVLFLKDKPTAKNLAALKDRIAGREYFTAVGRELYAYYPDGFAKTKFTLPLIDRILETTGTGRNWNTVLKLASAAGV
jgi:uncharacterized protein (DUF1697 family)